jgi:hypothetical protein
MKATVAVQKQQSQQFLMGAQDAENGYKKGSAI